MKWYHWLALAAATILIVATIIRVITPQPIVVPETPLVTTSVGGVKVNFSGLRYTGPEFKKPNELPIAPASITVNQSTFLNQLIANLGLKPHAVIPDFWDNEKYTLSFQPETGTATLSDATIFTRVASGPKTGEFSTDRAIAVADAFLADTLPGLNSMQAQTKNIVYLAGEGDAKRSDEKKADLIIIPFAPSIENVPIFIGNASTFPAEVFVFRDLTVAKVVFSPASIDFEPSSNAQILSVDKALENTNTNQKASITEFSNTEVGTSINLEEIVSGKMTEVFLEYRLDTQLQLIYPFYRFRGTVENREGNTFTIELITPAVATQAQL